MRGKDKVGMQDFELLKVLGTGGLFSNLPVDQMCHL